MYTAHTHDTAQAQAQRSEQHIRATAYTLRRQAPSGHLAKAWARRGSFRFGGDASGWHPGGSHAQSSVVSRKHSGKNEANGEPHVTRGAPFLPTSAHHQTAHPSHRVRTPCATHRTLGGNPQGANWKSRAGRSRPPSMAKPVRGHSQAHARGVTRETAAWAQGWQPMRRARQQCLLRI